MRSVSHPLQVTMSADGFWPCSLRWKGSQLRVLRVEGVYTRGRERCYRLRTSQGICDVKFASDTGRWQMLRAPSPFQRWWARILAMPRFPAPATRRRQARRAALRAPAPELRKQGQPAPVALVEGC